MTRRIKVATVLTAYAADGGIIIIVEIAAGTQRDTPRILKKRMCRTLNAARVTRHTIFQHIGSRS